MSDVAADVVARLVARVHGVAAASADAARAHHAQLAKPPGSLGLLEELGAQLAGIAGVCPPPQPAAPTVIVAAGDHGVHQRGVSPWPQEITAAMLAVMAQGAAAVNAIADVVGAQVVVVDVGVRGAPNPAVSLRRVADGTRDLSTEPAMTRDQAQQAIVAGAEATAEAIAGGADLIVTGDMGIANTTASACLIAAMTQRSAVDVTGPGAGAEGERFQLKQRVVAEAVALHRPDPQDPLEVLRTLGGLEHAALVGAMLEAAAARVPVVLDGVITNAAALVAVGLAPDLSGYLIAGHRSTEPGATIALERLRLQPLLNLQLRLGEGTGGSCAIPLIQAAARVLATMATIDAAAGSG